MQGPQQLDHAAWVAELLDLPMVYIRSKAKEHGKGNQIEGRIQSNQKMVVIEDLLSTGGSVLEACEAAKERRADVLGVAAIFTDCQVKKILIKQVYPM